MFSVDYDHESGLITCTCAGFLTIADVQSYEKELREAMPRSRQRFGHLRILVISIDSCVQSAEVMEAVARGRIPMTAPDDRMAVVVSSNLAKFQAARFFTSDKEKAFTSKAEAVAWLMADRPVGRSAVDRHSA